MKSWALIVTAVVRLIAILFLLENIVATLAQCQV